MRMSRLYWKTSNKLSPNNTQNKTKQNNVLTKVLKTKEVTWNWYYADMCEKLGFRILKTNTQRVQLQSYILTEKNWRKWTAKVVMKRSILNSIRCMSKLIYLNVGYKFTQKKKLQWKMYQQLRQQIRLVKIAPHAFTLNALTKPITNWKFLSQMMMVMIWW